MGQAETTPTFRAAPTRARLAAVRIWPLSGSAAAVLLVVVAGVSSLIRVYLTGEVRGPFVFMDELGYERMAQSFAHTGHFSLFGKEGLAYSPLYPMVIAPIYALSSSAHTAYVSVKALNAVLMSLSVFPLYAVARSVLPRPRALGVASLSLLLPLMFYADLTMSESLAYPLFLVAVWAMLRCVRRPGVSNDSLMLCAILLAAAARLQNIALLPAALTAVLLVPLVRPDDSQPRLRSLGAAIRRHWLLFGTCVVGAALVLAKSVVNGGELPLAGRYANVGTTHAHPIHALELAFQHLVELDFALGIIPFAGAMLAAHALVRLGFPNKQLFFGAVAASVTLWLLLEVGYNAAAFDKAGSVYGTPRIHERYLIYVMPLFLVAFVAALRTVRPRVSWVTHVAIAIAAAVAPAAIPFSGIINYTVPYDTFGLQIFATSVNGEANAIPQAALFAIGVGVFFMVMYLYAVLRPRPSFAVVMTVVALLMLSTLVRIRMHVTADKTYNAVPTHASWIDAAAHGHEVALVGGARRQSAALLLAAYENLSINRVYSTCQRLFLADFGERPLVAGADGRLLDGTAPVRSSYVLAPAALHLRGRVVARQRKEGLVLIEPVGGVLRTSAPVRCPS